MIKKSDRITYKVVRFGHKECKRETDKIKLFTSSSVTIRASNQGFENKKTLKTYILKTKFRHITEWNFRVKKLR